MIEDTLADRGAQYGSFDIGAKVVTDVCAILLPHGHNLGPSHEQAIRMIVAKLSRIIANPHKRDSWHDVAGYAICGEEACK